MDIADINTAPSSSPSSSSLKKDSDAIEVTDNILHSDSIFDGGEQRLSGEKRDSQVPHPIYVCVVRGRPGHLKLNSITSYLVTVIDV